MRITSGSGSNFASYRDLEFDFSNLGLTLISGPTGSGKSTLCDFVCWVLYGATSKGGSVEDVKSWGATGLTSGIMEVETPAGPIVVGRFRGRSNQNDLYWTEAGTPDEPIRGKDMAETQKMLEARLGVPAEIFHLTGYYSQFAEADRFFVMKPKDRREILEAISDLDMPISLAERSSELRKSAKSELETLQAAVDRLEGRILQANNYLGSAEGNAKLWDRSHAVKIDAVTQAVQAWDEKQRLAIAAAQDRETTFETERRETYSAILDEMERLDQQIQDPERLQTKADALKIQIAALEPVKKARTKLVTEVANMRAEMTSLERELARYQKHPDTCPTCLRPGAKAGFEAQRSACVGKLNTLMPKLNERITALEEHTEVVDSENQLLTAYAAALDKITANERLMAKFESQKEALITCDSATCNSQVEVQQLYSQVNPHLGKLDGLKQAENPYGVQISTIEHQLVELIAELEAAQAKLTELTDRVSSLTTLYDLSFVLRGELLKNSVACLERDTNQILEDYFDGEFRVSFSLDDDKLVVGISRGGYECPFLQLSGGQRRILTLSFWVALRRIAFNRAGTELSLLCGDEILNGLDDELKTKAFRLFQEISKETESVILVDHSEAFKNLFDSRFEVELVNDSSEIHRVT